jgi:AraC family transcriptional regulator, alkane utilization regulator
MDVLSEVLRVIRLSGGIHLHAEFTQPWAILASGRGFAARRNLSAECVTAFHVCVAGRCWVRCGDLPPTMVEAGDVIVFPRGDDHVMASDLALTPVPMKDIYPRPIADDVTFLRHGGGGEPARFICGFLHSDHQFGPLFESMPPLVCVRARDGGFCFEAITQSGQTLHPIARHEADWWDASLRFLVNEVMAPQPGNRAVLARLPESLFVAILRCLLRRAADDNRGWLAGLNDAQVGRALAMLHAEPARPWTVEELAQRVAMSRAAFAARFVELVGDPPMQYLTAWRMHLARNLLREGRLSIAEIASRVGYESEAAFNRAFRRAVGTPPAAWRRAGKPSATVPQVRSNSNGSNGNERAQRPRLAVGMLTAPL